MWSGVSTGGVVVARLMIGVVRWLAGGVAMFRIRSGLVWLILAFGQ